MWVNFVISRSLIQNVYFWLHSIRSTWVSNSACVISKVQWTHYKFSTNFSKRILKLHFSTDYHSLCCFCHLKLETYVCDCIFIFLLRLSRLSFHLFFNCWWFQCKNEINFHFFNFVFTFIHRHYITAARWRFIWS